MIHSDPAALSGIIKSAIDEPANLEQVIHHAQEVGFTVRLINWHARIVRIVVVSAAVGQRQRVTKLMEQSTGLVCTVPI